MNDLAVTFSHYKRGMIRDCVAMCTQLHMSMLILACYLNAGKIN